MPRERHATVLAGIRAGGSTHAAFPGSAAEAGFPVAVTCAGSKSRSLPLTVAGAAQVWSRRKGPTLPDSRLTLPAESREMHQRPGLYRTRGPVAARTQRRRRRIRCSACCGFGSRRCDSMQFAQMQASIRSSSGKVSSRSSGTPMEKHQQLPRPASTPQSLPLPQSGQSPLPETSVIAGCELRGAGGPHGVSTWRLAVEPGRACPPDPAPPSPAAPGSQAAVRR